MLLYYYFRRLEPFNYNPSPKIHNSHTIPASQPPKFQLYHVLWPNPSSTPSLHRLEQNLGQAPVSPHTTAFVSCWRLWQHVLPTLTQLHTGFQTNSASPRKSFSPSNISVPLALSNHTMDDTLLHAQGNAKGATFNINVAKNVSRVNFGTSTVLKHHRTEHLYTRHQCCIWKPET